MQGTTIYIFSVKSNHRNVELISVMAGLLLNARLQLNGFGGDLETIGFSAHTDLQGVVSRHSNQRAIERFCHSPLLVKKFLSLMV